MISKRSTSPLMGVETTHSYQHTATYPQSSIMEQWQMTSQAQTASFPIDTTPFTQQLEPFGPFQASPTEYLTQQATLEASLEANMNPNMGPNMSAGLPMDPTYIAIANSIQGNPLQSAYGDMTSSLNSLGQISNQWAEAVGVDTMNPYDMQTMQFMAQNLPVTGPTGSPSEGYLSDPYDIQSLRSDNDWTTIERTDPHMGTIYHPQQTLHPRTCSDSSSDNEQSRSSLDGFVPVSNGPSSPSNDSNGELYFYSDPEHQYDMERHSPPVIISHTLIKPTVSTISTNQPPSTSSISPQRSPTSPASRSRPRKNTASKPGAAPKGVTKKTPQTIKGETTEKRVGRRKGPLRPDQRKQASEIRKLGACIRCRFLKKTVCFTLTSVITHVHANKITVR